LQANTRNIHNIFLKIFFEKCYFKLILPALIALLVGENTPPSTEAIPITPYGDRPRRVHFKKFDEPEKYNFVKCEQCDIQTYDLNWYWGKSHEECIKVCKWYGNECTFYTWNEETKKCYLGTGVVHFEDFYHVKDTKVNSAVHCGLIKTRECLELMNNVEFAPKFYTGYPEYFLRSYGCYFNSGHTYVSFYNSSVQDCINECRNLPACTHFNHFPDFCNLYSGKITIEEMEECPTPPCHCGIDCQAVNLANDQVKYCSMSNQYEYVKIPRTERFSPAPEVYNPGNAHPLVDRRGENVNYPMVTYEGKNKKLTAQTFDFD